MGGRLTVSYTDFKTGETVVADFGTVTKVAPSFQKKAQVTPIVSLNMQSAFPLEMGNSSMVSFTFSHKNGQGGLTNAEWYAKITQVMDRWQARSNGCLVNFESDDGIESDVIKNVGGYIKNISRTYSDYNELITGSVDIAIGTMYVNDTDEIEGVGAAQDYHSMFIMLSDSEQKNWYAIQYGATDHEEYNLIDSLTITGGVETPFEKAVIKIPKKKLYETIPNLQGDIIDRHNKLIINCMGQHNMYLDQANISDSTITLTGMTYAAYYQLSALQTTTKATPLEHIRSILSDSANGVMYDLSQDAQDKQFITNCTDTSDVLTFKVGTKLWRVLQICATMLGGRLFFADNKAYLLNYTVKIDNEYTKWMEYIDIQGSADMRKRMVSYSQIDQEGFAPVKNTATILATNSEGSSVTKLVTDNRSVAKYGTLDKGTINLSELDEVQADKFAINHLRYIREPQRSIRFTLKEGYGQSGSPEKVWMSYFGPSAQVGKIIDRENSDQVSNRSTLYSGYMPIYNKLMLSSYVRQFPKLTCEYTFGTIANISLSDNTSQVTNTLNAP